MAKFHPMVLDDVGSARQRKLKDIARDLVGKVDNDMHMRETWLRRQRRYYQRRYARLFRHTQWPWKGASDVVMPTIDMTIDRLKATITRTVFTRPIVTFEAKTPGAQDQARVDQQFFNWLIGTHIKDFKRQAIIGIDSLLQHGFCIFKIFWDYRTRKVSRVLNLGDLPQRYADLIPQIAAIKANARFQEPSGDVLQRSPEATLQVKRDVAQALRPRIAIDYNLDPEDEEDQKALDKIVEAFASGKKSVRYKTREVEADNPRLVCIDPQDFIVPSTTRDIQDAQRVVQRLWLTESSFKQRGRDHKWKRTAIKQVLEKRAESQKRGRARSSRGGDEFENRRDQREGLVSAPTDDLIEIWEVHWMMDIDGDGVDEKVWAPLHPGTGIFLKSPREEPYEHGQWPYVQVNFELNDGRFFSPRGVPEKLDDIDIEITKRHRAKLNALDMRVPMWTYRFGSEINPSSIRFKPGGFIPVVNPGDIQPLPIPNYQVDAEREENILRTWAQDYLGGVDNLSAQANISDARTATEVRALQQAGAESLSHRAEVIQLGFGEVYGQIWDLWNQWGDEFVYTRVVGHPFRRKTKEEIRSDFNIVPVGTVITTDPELEKVRARERFQVLLQLWNLTGGTGMLAGTHRIDIVEALMFWLERENLLESRSTIRRLSQQEQQQILQQLQARNERRERLEDNVPMSLEEAAEAVKEVKQNAPNKGRQRILS